MIKLLRYLKTYIKECILGPLFKLLEASFELMIPLVVKAIIDGGIGEGNTSYVVKMVLLMAALGFIGLISAVTAQFFAARAATGFAAKVKSVLFAHMQTLSYTELDSLGTSGMITRLTSDMNTMQNGVNLVLRLFLRSPFIVFGAMIMAFTIDGKAALSFAIAIPLLALVVFGIMLATIPLYKKVQSRLDAVLRTTRENLYGVRVLRAFRRQDDESVRFTEESGALAKAQLFVGRISALMSPMTYVIVNAAVILLIYVSGGRVNEGALTQGDVVALYNYMSQILVELIKLANLIITVTKSFASGARVQAVLELSPSMTYPDTTEAERKENYPQEWVVTFQNVTFTYKGAAESSISDVTFFVLKGETVGIIGATGSGKSTLVNLIPRFYDTTEGLVTIDDLPVSAYSKADLRKKIAIVPQKAVLFSGTIADNLRFGNPDATDEELLEAIHLAMADDVIASKEKGLYEPVLAGGKNFSGGQRQRLTIARALVCKPEILILDDSASALDYATDAALRANLRTLKNMTVFIVSQRAASIMDADDILVLDDGVLVGQGTHEELLATCEEYKEIYASQFDDSKERGEASK